MSVAFMSYENMDRPVESVLLYISAERVMIGTCEAFFMLFITAPASFFSPRRLDVGYPAVFFKMGIVITSQVCDGVQQTSLNVRESIIPAFKCCCGLSKG